MTKTQKLMALPAIGLITLISGAVAGFASLASAQSTDTSSTTSTANAPTQMPQNFDPTKGGHVGANGVKEVLLTGDTATKATAAALAAVPGGTIERVETDAEGATYEAHMTKADGSRVTVKMDANFNVTSTEDGPNFGGPQGTPLQNTTSTTNQ
jgi:hypothetical protein